MGLGSPMDLLEAVDAGVDMFDCVLPTRMARTGTVLTRDGRLVIKNNEYSRDQEPLDAECGCPVCARHSRGYIRHLFQAKEILGVIGLSNRTVATAFRRLRDRGILEKAEEGYRVGDPLLAAYIRRYR